MPPAVASSFSLQSLCIETSIRWFARTHHLFVESDSRLASRIIQLVTKHNTLKVLGSMGSGTVRWFGHFIDVSQMIGIPHLKQGISFKNQMEEEQPSIRNARFMHLDSDYTSSTVNTSVDRWAATFLALPARTNKKYPKTHITQRTWSKFGHKVIRMDMFTFSWKAHGAMEPLTVRDKRDRKLWIVFRLSRWVKDTPLPDWCFDFVWSDLAFGFGCEYSAFPF